ncbi:hypothetical protein HMPREF0080_00596 [Anaeroglobus geminatus F0357]|uniref:Uncharacterized protein n=1 Tax=Anaeroglobus geminatus F0357 TaxID=861450 RepID=G9YG32_9FIRM|nr:hypothetical protein HMPREF0080_00596 [Anaeroglobus geminatus F0357]
MLNHFGEEYMFFFLMMINVRIVADEVDDADNIQPLTSAP